MTGRIGESNIAEVLLLSLSAPWCLFLLDKVTPQIGFLLAGHSLFTLIGSVVDLLTSCSLDILFP